MAHLLQMQCEQPFNESRLGLGVSIINDKIGPIQENSISTDLSYHYTNIKWQNSPLESNQHYLFDLDVSRLNPWSRWPSLHNYNNKLSPNIGAGLYLHSDKAYVGLSVPNFLETNRYDSNDVKIFKEKVNLLFNSGLYFWLQQLYKIQTCPTDKKVKRAPLQVDVWKFYV
jgi:type IX secretion system PorP/SprF family membrane protein